MNTTNDDTPVEIPGFNGRYTITKTGVVIGRKWNRPLATSVNDSGYRRVKLTRLDGKRWCPGVHKLLALTFLNPPGPGQETVNHIDGNKLNNALSNLEWATRSENVMHSYRIGLQVPIAGSRHYMAKLNEEKVSSIRRERAKGVLLETLAKRYGVTAALIGMICKRTIWKHAA